MNDRTFVGFGFGAIQAGLFLHEAFRSGAFHRLIVAEVVPEIVQAIRDARGVYAVNVATATGIETQRVEGVEIVNPLDPSDRARLIEAIEDASEIATALPSIAFYEQAPSPPQSVAGILAEGLCRKCRRFSPVPCIVYTAENHNHAAEILEQAVERLADAPFLLHGQVQFLNTVIGKMSGVVTEPTRIREEPLEPVVPGLSRAFLVEAFNRILISRITLPGFMRGIRVFEEKDNLLPFEEAKLYGHNATHALIGYLGWLVGHRWMSDAGRDPRILPIARQAFLEETGCALIARYQNVDPLFTRDGWSVYVEDLLVRMANPFLRDAVERIIRDPARKLGWNDRLVGAMRLALSIGQTPRHFARGAAAALRYWKKSEPDRSHALETLWQPDRPDPVESARIRALITKADSSLSRLGLNAKGHG